MESRILLEIILLHLRLFKPTYIEYKFRSRRLHQNERFWTHYKSFIHSLICSFIRSFVRQR